MRGGQCFAGEGAFSLSQKGKFVKKVATLALEEDDALSGASFEPYAGGLAVDIEQSKMRLPAVRGLGPGTARKLMQCTLAWVVNFCQLPSLPWVQNPPTHPPHVDENKR